MPGCRPGVVAAGPRDSVRSGSRETRTRNGVNRTCFQDRLLIRPDDFRKVPGVGIEPTPSWFRARRHYQQQLPRNRSAQATQVARRGSRLVRGAGLEPASPGSKPGSLPLADPRVKKATECPAGIEPALPAWKAGTSAARPRAQSCGGRNRTCVGAVNSRLPVPARVPPQYQSARLESNQHLRAPEARGLSISPTRRIIERPAGIEPAHPPWQGSRLPLHHGRLCVTTNLSRNQSTGPDSNRRHRITGAESWPLDDQCLLSVGPEGLEPSPPRLRAAGTRHPPQAGAGSAAANTLIL